MPSHQSAVSGFRSLLFCNCQLLRLPFFFVLTISSSIRQDRRKWRSCTRRGVVMAPDCNKKVTVYADCWIHWNLLQNLSPRSLEKKSPASMEPYPLQIAATHAKMSGKSVVVAVVAASCFSVLPVSHRTFVFGTRMILCMVVSLLLGSVGVFAFASLCLFVARTVF